MSLIALLSVMFILPHVKSEEYDRIDHRAQIFSLKMNDRVSGQFVLGSGSIDSKSVYSFYVKDSDGFYKLMSQPANATRIKEVSDEPQLFYQTIYYRIPGWLCPWGRSQSETNYDLFVPKGTIIEQFSAN